MKQKFKIAIPELPIDRSTLPSHIFDECELLEGDKAVRGDNAQLMKYIDEVDAIIFNSSNTIDAELMKAAPKLKIVFKSGARPENVDYAYAKAHDIAVGWTPAANAQSVAEYTILLMMAALRQFPAAKDVLANGGWRNQCGLGHDICGLTVGLVGFGGIGRNVAQMLKGFQANVVAYDPYTPDALFIQCGVKRVTLDELMKCSDIISIHCLLTDETRNMFDLSAFEKMKQSAILVNSARGGMIDELALTEALRTHQIAGAAIDVYASEPPALDHPFRTLDNIIMTPHIAARTQEASWRECAWSIEGALDYLNGREIKNAVVVPPERN